MGMPGWKGAGAGAGTAGGGATAASQGAKGIAQGNEADAGIWTGKRVHCGAGVGAGKVGLD